MEESEYILEELMALVSNSAADNESAVVPQTFANLSPQKASRAIDLCRKGLETEAALDRPTLAAVLSRVLADALLHRPGPLAADDVDEAIAACQRCLQVWDAQSSQREYGKIQGLLGLAYSVRCRGDRQDNAETSISHFRAALDVLTPETDQCAWAKICHNLGSLYIVRRQGVRSTNTEMAIRYCEMALDVFKKDDNPVRWGVMQSDLGLAYVSSDSKDDCDAAIEHLIKAIDLFNEHRSGPQVMRFLGHAHQRLGLAYRYRKERDGDLESDGDLEKDSAIPHFEEAVAIFTELRASSDSALAQYELAKEYLKRGSDKSPSDIERAVILLQSAIKDESSQTNEDQQANLQFTLARALCRRTSEHEADDLHAAVQYYRESLEIFRRNPSSAKSAIAERELAAAQARLASHTEGNSRE